MTHFEKQLAHLKVAIKDHIKKLNDEENFTVVHISRDAHKHNLPDFISRIAINLIERKIMSKITAHDFLLFDVSFFAKNDTQFTVLIEIFKNQGEKVFVNYLKEVEIPILKSYENRRIDVMSTEVLIDFDDFMNYVI